MSGEPVLIVDDSPANLKLFKVLLEVEGYDVRTAADGAAALALLERFMPRLILMDIQMPGLDGLSLTRRLKAHDATRAIVILALTAYAMKGDEDRARAAGCDGYVTKPVNTEVLAALVAAYLRPGAAAGGRT